MDYDALAVLARPALVVAAARRTTITYGELARAIDFPDDLPLAHHLRHVLSRVADECTRRVEPRLDVLVINGETGEPGGGWADGDRPWPREVVNCHRHWTQS